MKIQKATPKMCPHLWAWSNGLTGLQDSSMWVVRSTCTDKVYFLPQIKPNSTDWLAMAPPGLKRSLIFTVIKALG